MTIKSAAHTLIRLPLKLVPSSAVLPVLSGPNRGRRWVVGSMNHGCWLGWYESDVIRPILSCVKPGMVAFDIGANVGYYTLALSKAVGAQGKVVALEPDRTNLSALRWHLDLNAVSNVEVIEAAADKDGGTATFSGTHATGRLCPLGRPVRTIRLDDLGAPDFIKMDIEGGETNAVAGATEILERRKTVWAISLHDGHSFATVPPLLSRFGYEIEWIDPATIIARPNG